MHVGFTGTRRGMTDAQFRSLHGFLSSISFQEFHHGDCIGADLEAHEIALSFAKTIVIHPPSNSSKQAFFHLKGNIVVLEPKDYLDRNHEIVDMTDMLIATPLTKIEVQRSGTWATIRYAMKQKKQVTVIYPDGHMGSNINRWNQVVEELTI